MGRQGKRTAKGKPNTSEQLVHSQGNGHKLFVGSNLLVSHSIDFSQLMFTVISKHKPKYKSCITILDLALKADAAFVPYLSISCDLLVFHTMQLNLPQWTPDKGKVGTSYL